MRLASCWCSLVGLMLVLGAGCAGVNRETTVEVGGYGDYGQGHLRAVHKDGDNWFSEDRRELHSQRDHLVGGGMWARLQHASGWVAQVEGAVYHGHNDEYTYNYRDDDCSECWEYYEGAPDLGAQYTIGFARALGGYDVRHFGFDVGVEIAAADRYRGQVLPPLEVWPVVEIRVGHLDYGWAEVGVATLDPRGRGGYVGGAYQHEWFTLRTGVAIRGRVMLRLFSEREFGGIDELSMYTGGLEEVFGGYVYGTIRLPANVNLVAGLMAARLPSGHLGVSYTFR